MMNSLKFSKSAYQLIMSVSVFALISGGCASTEQKADVAPEPAKEVTTQAPAEPAAVPEEEIKAEAQVEDIKPSEKLVLFEFNSADIDNSFATEIKKHAEYLKNNDDITITLEGHADLKGSKTYNKILGEKRAKAVESLLLENGIQANRIHVISFGEDKPIVKSKDAAEQAKNRRVEILYSAIAQ